MPGRIQPAGLDQVERWQMVGAKNGKGLVNNSVRTVFFDFDGTLVFHEPDSFDLISAYLAEIGQPLGADAERQGRRSRHQYFADPSIRGHQARMRPGVSSRVGLPRDEGRQETAFWYHYSLYLLTAMSVEGNPDQLAQELRTRFLETEFAYHCPEEGRQMLTELRARGYGLGLITNRDNVGRFHQLLDLTRLGPYFDLVLASGEVGVRKPEPGIFHAALDRLGCQANESLYIGDNYWADVVGAQRAGVTPVLLDPHHLFPEADCVVLESIEALTGLLD